MNKTAVCSKTVTAMPGVCTMRTPSNTSVSATEITTAMVTTVRQTRATLHETVMQMHSVCITPTPGSLSVCVILAMQVCLPCVNSKDYLCFMIY